MAAKHNLKRSIKHLLQSNKDGSYETQASRGRVLLMSADQLSQAGFKLNHIQGLKLKHIQHLNEIWIENGVSAATIKNRNAHLRWTTKKLGKHNMMPSNDKLGVGKRTYVTNENKAFELSDIDFTKVTNKAVYIQLHLQRHFGLRREEAIKFQPIKADKGNAIELDPTWCKGGRGRTVPVHTKEARYWLNEAKKLVHTNHESLIGTNKTYKSAKALYDKQVQRAEIKHPHGLRHAYAQALYKEITGLNAPCKGGLGKGDLTTIQRQKDYLARKVISKELGHSRISITAIYLGR